MYLNQIFDPFAFALNLLLGNRCPGCQRATYVQPCPDCIVELHQQPTAHEAAFHDSGIAGRMVRAGKDGRWRRAGTVLARLLLVRMSEQRLIVPMVDLITWVPADRRRRAVRGGHLPERVARTLGRELGIPAVPLLERHGGRPQRGLSRSERATNLLGAFRHTKYARGVLSHPGRGLRVLLLDDVRTTGATFEAASAALPPCVGEVACLALLGVDNFDDVPPGSRQNPARSEEILLTIHSAGADHHQYDR